MSSFASQFGNPRGLRGQLVGFLLTRVNAEFNRWIVGELRKSASTELQKIVELGPGPGIALEELLGAFPQARVWGVDHSATMLTRSRKRNRAAVDAGRLTLLEGEVSALGGLAPLDLVLAVHVIYFWPRAVDEFRTIHSALGSGGSLALGFQLRGDMRPSVQRNFPKEGFVLYDTESELGDRLHEAGFREIRFLFKAGKNYQTGRLALAVA